MVEKRQPFEDSLNRLKALLSPEEFSRLLSIQDNPLPSGIRINPLKGEPSTAIQNLTDRYDWQVQPVPFCDQAWLLIDPGETSPGMTIEHRMGEYYIQDAASMVPVHLFDIPSKAPMMLDIAASPGGKTTHLISRTDDLGFIIANDASKSRIPALRAVLSGWGGINQLVTQYPGESFGSWFPETFDLVLLDAPCSMENLRPTPNHPLRETTQDERLRLQERQTQLLMSGIRALKTGGQLVYATCSLAPEEDEAVLDVLLSQYGSSLEIVDVSAKVPYQTPGLTQFGNDLFHKDVENALRLWPHRTGMSGFFCALIQKTDRISLPKLQPPERDFSRTGLTPLTRDQMDQVTRIVRDAFGFRLEEILDNNRIDVMCRMDRLFLIPRAYLEIFPNLPFEYIGMPLGRHIGDEIEPAHDFISRFGRNFTRGKITISPEDIQLWIGGRDIRHPQTDLKAEGQYVVVQDEEGRNLGLGKLLPKRLRNMLPKPLI
jgi:16S rRNA (cytosine1407-C5)-methyltransferase